MNKEEQTPEEKLSRRERQILDIIYRLGKAAAAEVMEALDDPPGFSAIRKWLFLMEKKGLITHQKEGKQHIYFPVVTKSKARKSAIHHLVDTFFEGSRARAITALLKGSPDNLSEEEKSEIVKMIEKSQQGEN